MQRVERPTLFVNEAVCRANIDRLAEKAKSNGSELRPHFKTHQSHVIGEWYRQAGVNGITVSSLGMGSYFAKVGWKSITVAFPCNINEIDLINELAKSIELRLLVDNEAVVESLSKQLKSEVKIYIEIEAGGNRTGINVEQHEKILSLARLIDSKTNLSYVGIYAHAGHTYYAHSAEEVREIAEKSLIALNRLKSRIIEDFPSTLLCYGDTPSCSVLNTFEGVDEMSAGNFIFYDLMQTEIGSCETKNIGVAVYCPIVSINREKNQVYIYGGGVHFSKDKTDLNHYGRVANLVGDSFELVEDSYLIKLSQEHGIVGMNQVQIDQLAIGDCIYILPIHSCLTAEALGQYHLLNSDGTKLDHYSQKKHAI